MPPDLPTHAPAADAPAADAPAADAPAGDVPAVDAAAVDVPVVDVPAVDMAVDLAGARLANPVLTASGCAANGRELHRFLDVAGLGAVVTKTVMAAPRSGRGTPRMAETPSGMLNSIGLQGPGIHAFVEDDLAWLASVGARVVVSIAGSTAAEFAEVAEVLAGGAAFAEAVVAVEVNISCPNVANRGLVFACDPASSAEVVGLVRPHLPAGVPLLAKLTPDVTDLVPVAAAAVGAGADGLTLINTLLGMVIDTDRLRPQLAGLTGGLSGPAIRPVAVRAVWQVTAAMRAGLLPAVPVVGVGGVRTGRDALELVAAGASAVQVGTATFGDPRAPARVLEELTALVAGHGFERFADVVGVAHERVVAP
jgi:dihydroorotate dehydrogenase (NAD+) catalytic subunit